MIIAKKPSVGTIVAVKLTSGEELVGRIEAESDTDLTLKNPLSWMLTQQGIMPAPYMITVEDKPTVNISKTAISSTALPRKDISDAYTQLTSNIVTPPAGGMFAKG